MNRCAFNAGITVFLGILLVVILFILIGQAAPMERPLLRPGNPDTFPTANTHTALPSTTVSITYDEPIDPTTISTQTFAVHASQTGLLTRTYSVDANTISLTPTQPFKPGELVRVTATTGTLSLIDGQGPISPTVWGFRVAVLAVSSVFSDSGQSLGSSNSNVAVLGDVDGDGDLDAFVANWDQDNKLWLNNGTGTFSDSGQSLGSSYSNVSALGDVDSDGDLDVFIAIEQDQPNEVWLNNGTGTFSDSGLRLGNADTHAVALGDLDGDGDLDVFVGNEVGQANQIWLNNGGVQGGPLGTFSDSGQSLGGSDTWRVALGDLDADGDLDAFVANGNDQGNTVWLNDGIGFFSDSGQILGSWTSGGVALGDTDGDGDLDAFVANGNGQPNKVWLNNGLGFFSDSGQSLGNSDSMGLALGDLDGDGDLDAFVGNVSDQANRIWLNDGTGSFRDSGQSLGSFNSSSVALGDVDGDGDLDSFVSNGGQGNRVWLNTKPDDYSIYYVAKSCTGAPDPCFTTVQAAVDAVDQSDELIKIATGVYTEVNDYGETAQVAYLNKSLTIRGGYTTAFIEPPNPEANPVTLDAEGQGRVVRIMGPVSATLDGLLVTGGDSSDNGGGVLLEGGGRLALSRTRVMSNTAFGPGGGIALTAGSSAFMTDVSIYANVGCQGYGKGGGVDVREGSTASITGSRIYANTCTVGEGGGISVRNDSHLNLSKSWVVANASPGNDAGGINAETGTSTYVENSIIAGNTSGFGFVTAAAGGLFFGDGGPYRIINSHIVGNRATGVGGAIASFSAVQVEVTNTLIISNTGMSGIDDKYGNSAVFLLSHCDTYGNSPDGTAGVIINRINCLGTPPEGGLDPLMVGGSLPSGVGPAFAEQWMSYDYRLLNGSPAIDAGTSSGAPGTDIVGTPRDATPDMGAYEFRALNVIKKASPDPVQAGEPLTYTLRVTNTGGVDLHAIITDLLPAQVVPGGKLVWTPTITAPSGVWAETVVVTVTLGYSGTLTNVVQVATDEGLTGVYTSTATSQVTPKLEVTKSAFPDPVAAGDRMTYTIRITNTGNIKLHATVTDVLPDYVTPGGVLVWTPTLNAAGGAWTQKVVVTAEEDYSGTLTNLVQVTTLEGATGVFYETCAAIIEEFSLYLPLVLRNTP